MGIYTSYPDSIYDNGGENYSIKEYDPDTTYFAGAVVKHDGKNYLFNSISPVTGTFDESKWDNVDPAELNRFFPAEYTADANDFEYCRFEYNPFLKILLAHINVKFKSQIQTVYNNDLLIRFSMPFVGYGSSSSFAINGSNKLQYSQDSQICCQLLVPNPLNLKSGVSFWTNGVTGIYGMFTCQVFAWLKTENKNAV